MRVQLMHSFLKGGNTAAMDEEAISSIRSTLSVVHDKVTCSFEAWFPPKSLQSHALIARLISQLHQCSGPCPTPPALPRAFPTAPPFPCSVPCQPPAAHMLAFCCPLVGG